MAWSQYQRYNARSITKSKSSYLNCNQVLEVSIQLKNYGQLNDLAGSLPVVEVIFGALYAVGCWGDVALGVLTGDPLSRAEGGLAEVGYTACM